MRIFFIGTVEFSKKSLEKLILLKANIIGVATKSKSVFNSDYADLSEICENNKVECKYINDINDSNVISWIKYLKPDIIFCFGWSNLLKKEILNIPPLGVIGYHPSLLPYNRGRHPLIWAKALGMNKTGSTFFFLVERADEGDIISQEEIEIKFEDDAKTLYKKMTETALFQIEEILRKLINKTLIRNTQPKEIGNYWRKRNKSDGLIDFRMNSVNICNLVRALTIPYVGAHCIYKEKEIKIWEIEKKDYFLNNIEPGKVINIIGRTIQIKTGDSSVLLIKHEFENLPEIGEYIL